MQFNPAKHTKSYLLKNPKVAGQLANFSPEFGASDLAQDYDILTLNSGGHPLVLTLAIYNNAWVNTPATQDKRVLNIKGTDDYTVAHALSRDKNWMNSAIAEDFDVLSIADSNGHTVAFKFAEYYKEWAQSSAAVDKKVLQLAGVASTLVFKSDEWAMREELNTIDMLNLDIGGNKLAHILARSDLWAKSDIANTSEILKLRSNKGVSVAHELAKMPSWMETSTHQNLEILSLVDGSGTSVAFRLARFCEQWANTPAAQQLDVLKLKGTHGLTVAHALISEIDWLKTPAANNVDILKMTDDLGIPVVLVPFIRQKAFFLDNNKFCSTTSHWFKTTVLPNKDLYDFAVSLENKEFGHSYKHLHPPLLILASRYFSTDILNASNAKELLSLSYPPYGSVAQAVVYSNEHKYKIVDTLLKIISIGASYFTIKRDKDAFRINHLAVKLNHKELAEIVDGAIEIINNEIDPVVQAKLLIAAVSSVNNIFDDMNDFEKSSSMGSVQFIQNFLDKSIQDNPSVFDNPNLFQNNNSDTGVANLKKMLAEKKVGNTPLDTQVLPDDVLAPADMNRIH
jgi:hypothetical protein